MISSLCNLLLDLYKSHTYFVFLYLMNCYQFIGIHFSFSLNLLVSERHEKLIGFLKEMERYIILQTEYQSNVVRETYPGPCSFLNQI